MKQIGLQYFTDIHLTVLGLLIFFTLFIVVLLWVFRSSSQKIYKQVEQIPLKEGEFYGR